MSHVGFTGDDRSAARGSTLRSASFVLVAVIAVLTSALCINALTPHPALAAAQYTLNDNDGESLVALLINDKDVTASKVASRKVTGKSKSTVKVRLTYKPRKTAKPITNDSSYKLTYTAPHKQPCEFNEANSELTVEKESDSTVTLTFDISAAFQNKKGGSCGGLNGTWAFQSLSVADGTISTKKSAFKSLKDDKRYTTNRLNFTTSGFTFADPSIADANSCAVQIKSDGDWQPVEGSIPESNNQDVSVAVKLRCTGSVLALGSNRVSIVYDVVKNRRHYRIAQPASSFDVGEVLSGDLVTTYRFDLSRYLGESGFAGDWKPLGLLVVTYDDEEDSASVRFDADVVGKLSFAKDGDINLVKPIVLGTSKVNILRDGTMQAGGTPVLKGDKVDIDLDFDLLGQMYLASVAVTYAVTLPDGSVLDQPVFDIKRIREIPNVSKSITIPINRFGTDYSYPGKWEIKELSIVCWNVSNVDYFSDGVDPFDPDDEGDEDIHEGIDYSVVRGSYKGSDVIGGNGETLSDLLDFSVSSDDTEKGFAIDASSPVVNQSSLRLFSATLDRGSLTFGSQSLVTDKNLYDESSDVWLSLDARDFGVGLGDAVAYITSDVDADGKPTDAFGASSEGEEAYACRTFEGKSDASIDSESEDGDDDDGEDEDEDEFNPVCDAWLKAPEQSSGWGTYYFPVEVYNPEAGLDDTDTRERDVIYKIVVRDALGNATTYYDPRFAGVADLGSDAVELDFSMFDLALTNSGLVNELPNLDASNSEVLGSREHFLEEDGADAGTEEFPWRSTKDLKTGMTKFDLIGDGESAYSDDSYAHSIFARLRLNSEVRDKLPEYDTIVMTYAIPQEESDPNRQKTKTFELDSNDWCVQYSAEHEAYLRSTDEAAQCYVQHEGSSDVDYYLPIFREDAKSQYSGAWQVKNITIGGSAGQGSITYLNSDLQENQGLKTDDSTRVVDLSAFDFYLNGGEGSDTSDVISDAQVSNLSVTPDSLTGDISVEIRSNKEFEPGDGEDETCEIRYLKGGFATLDASQLDAQHLQVCALALDRTKSKLSKDTDGLYHYVYTGGLDCNVTKREVGAWQPVGIAISLKYNGQPHQGECAYLLNPAIPGSGDLMGYETDGLHDYIDGWDKLSFTISAFEFSEGNPAIAGLDEDKSLYRYDGTAKTPGKNLTYEGVGLKEGVDYTAAYYRFDGDNRTALKKVPSAPGTYQAVFTGKGKFADGRIEREFTIEKLNLGDPDVKAQGPAAASKDANSGDLSVTVKVGDIALPASDYRISDVSSIDGKELKITVSAASDNLVEGSSATTTVKSLDPEGNSAIKDLSSADVEVTLKQEEWTYTGAPIMPKVASVTVDGAEVDRSWFTVDYANNVSVPGSGADEGQKPAVLVKGKLIEGEDGSWTGCVGMARAPFSIVPAALSDCEVSIGQLVYSGSSLKDRLLSTLNIWLPSGAKLDPSSYAVKVGTLADDGSFKDLNDAEAPVGAGRYAVMVEGRGGAASEKVQEFEVRKATLTGSQVSVNFSDDGAPRGVSVVAKPGLWLDGDDYDVAYTTAAGEPVSDIGTAGPGEYQAVVSGKGNNIAEKPKLVKPFFVIANLDGEDVVSFEGGADEVSYTGHAIDVRPTVKYNEKPLRLWTDYVVIVTRDGKPCVPCEMGEYQVMVEGRGMYKGTSKPAPFTVTAADLGKLGDDLHVSMGDVEYGKQIAAGNIDVGVTIGEASKVLAAGSYTVTPGQVYRAKEPAGERDDNPVTPEGGGCLDRGDYYCDLTLTAVEQNGSCTGSATVCVPFKVTKASLGNARIEDASDQSWRKLKYNGKGQKANPPRITVHGRALEPSDYGITRYQSVDESGNSNIEGEPVIPGKYAFAIAPNGDDGNYTGERVFCDGSKAEDGTFAIQFDLSSYSVDDQSLFKLWDKTAGLEKTVGGLYSAGVTYTGTAELPSPVLYVKDLYSDDPDDSGDSGGSGDPGDSDDLDDPDSQNGSGAQEESYDSDGYPAYPGYERVNPGLLSDEYTVSFRKVEDGMDGPALEGVEYSNGAWRLVGANRCLDLGEYKLTITGGDMFAGSIERTFTVKGVDLSVAGAVRWDRDGDSSKASVERTFNGAEFDDGFSVAVGGKSLSPESYTYAYWKKAVGEPGYTMEIGGVPCVKLVDPQGEPAKPVDAGEYYLVVEGAGEYHEGRAMWPGGVDHATVVVKPLDFASDDIAKFNFSWSKDRQKTYDGEPLAGTPTIKARLAATLEWLDLLEGGCKVAFRDSDGIQRESVVDAGSYTPVVIGVGNYEGEHPLIEPQNKLTVLQAPRRPDGAISFGGVTDGGELVVEVGGKAEIAAASSVDADSTTFTYCLAEGEQADTVSVDGEGVVSAHRSGTSKVDVKASSKNYADEAFKVTVSAIPSREALAAAVQLARTKASGVRVVPSQVEGEALYEDELWVDEASSQRLADSVNVASDLAQLDDGAFAQVDGERYNEAYEGLVNALKDYEPKYGAKTVSSGVGDLKDAVAAANARLDSVKESADGSDVRRGLEWATAEARSQYAAAIESASADAERFSAAVANSDVTLASSEVDGSCLKLKAATEAFVPNVSEGASAVSRERLTSAIDDASGFGDTLTRVVDEAEGMQVGQGLKWVIASDAAEFDKALEDAKALAGDEDASEREVSSAWLSLTEAHATLQGAWKLGTALTDEQAAAKEELGSEVASAEQVISSTKVSEDGLELPAGTSWATRQGIDALSAACEKARLTLGDASVLGDEYASVLVDLRAAVEAFGARQAQAPSGDDVEKLAAAIASAQEAYEATRESEDGIEVAADESWATENARATLKDAIDAAIALSGGVESASVKQVRDAVANLEAATTAFESGIQVGLAASEADKAELEEAIDAAVAAKSGISSSSNGSGLAAGSKWAPPEAFEALDAAIAESRALADVETPSHVAYGVSLGSLDEATRAFISQIRTVPTPTPAPDIPAEPDYSSDRAALADSIARAVSAREGVSASSDGNGLEAGAKWATGEVIDDFEGSIAAAQAVLSSGPGREYGPARQALDSARAAFEGKVSVVQPPADPRDGQQATDPADPADGQTGRAETPASVVPGDDSAASGGGDHGSPSVPAPISIGSEVETDISSERVDVKVVGTDSVVLDDAARAEAGSRAGGTLVINTVVLYDGNSYNVVEIAPKALEGTTAKKVIVGDNVVKIGDAAFQNAKRLTSVSVGDGVKAIGAKTFNGCKKLKAVTLGKKVGKVGKAVFKGCKKLKKVTVKSSKLSKASCKNIVKGSKIKTIAIKATGSKAAKQKILKRYKSYFSKKNTGKSVKVKLV